MYVKTYEEYMIQKSLEEKSNKLFYEIVDYYKEVEKIAALLVDTARIREFPLDDENTFDEEDQLWPREFNNKLRSKFSDNTILNLIQDEFNIILTKEQLKKAKGYFKPVAKLHNLIRFFEKRDENINGNRFWTNPDI
jgi:hypothetical protein